MLVRLALEKIEMAKSKRNDLAVDDENRPHARSQSQKEHLTPFVAAQGLHAGVVHDFGRNAEGVRVVKANPAGAEVVRFGGRFAIDHLPWVADRNPLVRPAFQNLANFLDEFQRRHVFAGADLDLFGLAGAPQLDIGAADIDDEVARVAGASRCTERARAVLSRHGYSLRFADTDEIRRLDDKVLTLSTRAARATQRFQLAHQIALLSQNDLLEATLDLARFQTPTARAIAKIGLANYFAGAALLPYQVFLAAARETRHDLERLSDLFTASIEQIAHRLSTMQRPGQKGIPFFFVRVDQAGTITKRHSATRLQFARFGGACPLWNVHQAFETPGRFLRQLAETPDGVRYFCLAHDVSKPGGSFRAPVRRYAICLGCEISHARDLIYTDGMDLTNARAFEPIGISCRICERADCHQRSVPPLERQLRVDPNRRGVLPYDIA